MPSWQSRLAGRFIRWHIKSQPRVRGPELVENARAVFGDISGSLAWIFHLFVRIIQVDKDGIRGEWQEPRRGARNRTIDRKSTRLNSSHLKLSRMPSSA